ncbi:hypothetical protein BU24DRAFT_450604 [Aaosphaeria arxii CBS 175.79]|uniref:Uncharacterized protein n=1 Tax=Aaosphaeria arxii CBS 175.79 TaxID=1450172 RepID=A0A6A5XRQ3_9PLEO|nr:uncharacterized protein BU24DRAFT_450604 [Aaosphaeria arxii CBS 175.79]KAF2015985.1 hypothetical protein BU24DRAFT_450604 [Aaosphaeria arxii CBS 175.79]
MATLAANDQENVVRNLQAGPAGKALNAGMKGFHSKTPGHKAPKTPFKVPLNDENATFKAGKSILQTRGKGNENLLKTTSKGGKLDSNAFVTPAGPRNRAPLGMKTTNAKGQAFKTPAPLSASGKTQRISPRLHRPKVKVLQEQAKPEEQDDVPEVEYMPPKEIPLPETFDDDMPPIDWDFPRLTGKKGTRKVRIANSCYEDVPGGGQCEVDEDLVREQKKASDEFDKLFEEMTAKDDAEARRYLGIESPKKAVPKAELPKMRATAPSTIKARSAAAALSPVSKPRFAAPTVVAKSRGPTTFLPSRRTAKPAISASTARNATAAAASRSTIGYAQGRAAGASNTARKPLSNVTRPPSRTATSHRPTTASSTRSTNASSVAGRPRGPFSRSSSTSTQATLVNSQVEEQPYRTAEDVENEMRLMLLQRDNDSEDEAWMNSFNAQVQGGAFDDELDDFQLQLPAGL